MDISTLKGKSERSFRETQNCFFVLVQKDSNPKKESFYWTEPNLIDSLPNLPLKTGKKKENQSFLSRQFYASLWRSTRLAYSAVHWLVDLGWSIFSSRFFFLGSRGNEGEDETGGVAHEAGSEAERRSKPQQSRIKDGPKRAETFCGVPRRRQHEWNSTSVVWCSQLWFARMEAAFKKFQGGWRLGKHVFVLESEFCAVLFSV
jgi:hypothetical protein